MHASYLLRHLARNSAWSNARLAEACGRLSAEEQTATRTSFFPSLLLTLRHIWIVDVYYLDALAGGGRGRAVFAHEESLPARLSEVISAQRSTDEQLIRHVDSLDDDALDGAVILDRRTGPQRDRVGDVLMHLFVHQIHHRGQAHAMLAGTAVPPPPLDEYFCAEERPAALAELAAVFPSLDRRV